MRPVERGNCPIDAQQRPVVYSNYSDARGELIKRLGQYCSYCEMKLDSALHVEHVKPKKPRGSTAIIQSRLLNWDNFLLACTNCNSTKGDADVNLPDYVWPDTDNTFRAFIYSKGGVVTAASGAVNIQSQNMISLVGLDKSPDTSSASDRRWNNRREAWDMAEMAKRRLASRDIVELREQIADTVFAEGYWSIWMTVFKDDSDMLCRFINRITGTSTTCFDHTGLACHRQNGVC